MIGRGCGANCVMYVSLVLTKTVNGVVSDIFCNIIFGRDARDAVTSFIPMNRKCSR